MSNNQLCAILTLLVPQLIKEITENENITENEAVEALYCSVLYSDLENEKTKLWHLSPKALYELYSQEKRTGRIDYPEEV